MSEEKETKSAVDAALQQGQESLNAQVAIKAIGLVKPMLDDCCKQINDYLGDTEKIIFLNKTKKDAPVGIIVMDTKKNFEVKGGGEKLIFKGDKGAMIKYYTAEEFVELLLTGRLKELTEKLLS